MVEKRSPPLREQTVLALSDLSFDPAAARA
jgi:hypothetical protein